MRKNNETRKNGNPADSANFTIPPDSANSITPNSSNPSEPYSDFISRLIAFTETLLTRRARGIEKKKQKQAKRGRILGWIDAFLWAVMVVLILNQYLLQGYQIPSGSMRNTLIGGRDPLTGEQSTSDRIFVDKFSFGPELLPGMAKIPGILKPKRGDIIIFESPNYNSPSTGYEIAQRIIYMLSLSAIDLNRIRYGQVAVQFLVKRQIAENGDIVHFHRGQLYIKPTGGGRKLSEKEFKENSQLDYENSILLSPAYYNSLRYDLEKEVFERAGLSTPPEFISAAAETGRDSAETGRDSEVPALGRPLTDQYETQKILSAAITRLNPYNEFAVAQDAAYRAGIYVPKGWILPLGDNRSDSLDGRYFGPVKARAILGRTLFRYWPLDRFGYIK